MSYECGMKQTFRGNCLIRHKNGRIRYKSGPIEEERDSSIQDPAAQQHLRRYPMAVCDPEERWVREYMEQTGEEPGFF